jgi:hypothetical protein
LTATAWARTLILRVVSFPLGGGSSVMEWAMSQNSGQDVVIRSRLTIDGTEFIVVCGNSARLLGGPFAGMSEAVEFAAALPKEGPRRILYEAHDERGRTLGERMLLRTA